MSTESTEQEKKLSKVTDQAPAPQHPAREITLDHRFSYGQRLTKMQRRRAVEYLIQRDFNSDSNQASCFNCKNILPDPFKADLDHINGNKHDHRACNIRLACHSCNSSLQRIPRYTAASSDVEKEKLVSVGVSATDKLQRDVRYGEGSVEMQVTSVVELAWRNWVAAWVLKRGWIGEDQVVYDGAGAAGCSPSTTYRYMRKWSIPWAETTGVFEHVYDPVTKTDVLVASWRHLFWKLTYPNAYAEHVKEVV